MFTAQYELVFKQSNLLFVFKGLTGKLAWNMFKKVHRNEINIWLLFLSL